MPRRRRPPAEENRLPELLRPLFWEYAFARLSLAADRDLILAKVLGSGNWTQIAWLRRELGDESIRAFLERRRGAGLTPPQLRFWQLLLDLPKREVDEWLSAPGRQAWDRRVRR
jgi:hypothetical protein